jgi:Acetyltransferase (GNAT) domain
VSIGSSFRCVVHTDIDELPLDVVSFVAAGRSDRLCLDTCWFDLLLRHALPCGTRPRVYVVRSAADAAVGCVLFAMAEDGPQRGRALRSLTNFYTTSFAPIVAEGAADVGAALAALAHFIRSERPAWDVVELRGLIAEDAASAATMRAFRSAGMLVDAYPQYENWFLPTAGLSAAEFYRSRPSRLRNTIGRKLKKAVKEDALDFALYASADALADGLAAYQAVYARSWKQPEAAPEFIPQLARRWAERGDLRLGVLRVGGAPAAAQMWLISGRRATIYKLAYDEAYASLSVGSILTRFMFDRVLDGDRPVEVDFGVGGESYKLDWMSDCRNVVGLVCFNPLSPRGLLGAARHFAGRARRRPRGRGASSPRPRPAASRIATTEEGARS